VERRGLGQTGSELGPVAGILNMLTNIRVPYKQLSDRKFIKKKSTPWALVIVKINDDGST
jgi:hypothetical protein